MEILRSRKDSNLVINQETDFRLDLGWQDNMDDFESETLQKIINPVENYETVRYIHKPYTSNSISQTDIWFYFYFLSGTTYVQDYSPTGLSIKENTLRSIHLSKSFFRLEFFKTPNDAAPDRTNRRLVFAKNLPVPLGQEYFYTPLNTNILVPVFMGSNYVNKENMYLFWFQDESAFNETNLTGNTFYMTAKFFNAEDGSIRDFTTSALGTATTINESNDMYFKVIIDKSDYTYQIFRYNGTVGSRIGESNDPIKFYEKGGGTVYVAP
jgi:hypothetical protein